MFLEAFSDELMKLAEKDPYGVASPGRPQQLANFAGVGSKTQTRPTVGPMASMPKAVKLSPPPTARPKVKPAKPPMARPTGITTNW